MSLFFSKDYRSEQQKAEDGDFHSCAGLCLGIPIGFIGGLAFAITCGVLGVFAALPFWEAVGAGFGIYVAAGSILSILIFFAVMYTLEECAKRASQRQHDALPVDGAAPTERRSPSDAAPSLGVQARCITPVVNSTEQEAAHAAADQQYEEDTQSQPDENTPLVPGLMPA